MAARSALHASTLVIFLTLLAGCTTNTKNDLAKQKLNALKKEADSLEALKNDLIIRGGSNQILEGPGTVSIFLSKNVIDSALGRLAGVILPVPNAKGATLTLKSVTADLEQGYAPVSVDAEATKKGLGKTLQVVGTGHLETKIDPDNPSQLTVTVRLDELVPKAQWGSFDFKVKGFVQDLMRAQDTEGFGNLGTIQIPITTDIPLAVPAIRAPVSFPGAQAIISAPGLTITGHMTVSRVLVMPDGLHVYGVVSAKVGS